MAGKYPDVITPELLAKYEHIPDDEVALDIRETESEIERYRSLQKAEEDIARVHPNANERKMADFRASSRPEMIRQRLQFVEFLKRLQEARKNAKSQT